MNLYLVFALALGAISGVVEAPVSRPVLSTLAAQRGSHAHRQALRTPLNAPRLARVATTCPAPEPLRRFGAPLTGAASPRAPAIG